MKSPSLKYLTILMAASLVTQCAFLDETSSQRELDPLVVNLITTNDLHGVIYEQEATFMNPAYPPKILGGAAMFKYMTDLREKAGESGEGVLVLDGGNFFQGTPMGMADAGETMLEWMNRIGYDAMVPGVYDFVLGSGTLNQLAGQAKFPFLTANLDCADCPLTDPAFKPYIIKEINGVRFGIIGIVDADVEKKVLGKNLPGITATTEARAMQEWVPQVKAEGADVIIVLNSSGVPWDREIVYEDFKDSLATGWQAEDSPLNAIQMGYYAHGVDLIIAGGNSKGYPGPWYDPNSHVFVFQNYGNGTEFGHVRLKFDPESHYFQGFETVIDGRVSQTMLADDFSVDGDMLDWIRERNAAALETAYAAPQPMMTGQKTTECNQRTEACDRDDWKIPSVNRDSEFEIITWNCEFFPTNDEETILALSEAISDLNADMYAMQEIRFPGWFTKLMAELPQYDFVFSQNSSFMDQAIIYKKNMFQVVRQLELFTEDDYNFAGRPPLQADFLYICDGDTTEFSVIDLHMKCCDSGLARRQNAARMLHTYLAEQLDSGVENFIVLGDWNDDVKDEENAHCFHPFFEDDRFYFPTFDITYDLTQASYPKKPYVSFLDHVLVTESFLAKDSGYKVMTIPMDRYMGSYDTYEENISDHKPVMLRFPFDR